MITPSKARRLFAAEYTRGYNAARDSAVKMGPATRKLERERAYDQMDSFDYGWADFFMGRPNRYETDQNEPARLE